MRRTTCTCLMAAVFMSSLVVKSTFAQNDKWKKFHRIKRERLQEFRAQREAISKEQVYEIELKHASDAEVAMLKASGASELAAHPDRFTVTGEQLRRIKTPGLPIRILQTGLRVQGNRFGSHSVGDASAAEDEVSDCEPADVDLDGGFAFSFIDFTSSTFAGVVVKRFDIDYDIIHPFRGQLELYLTNGNTTTDLQFVLEDPPDDDDFADIHNFKTGLTFSSEQEVNQEWALGLVDNVPDALTGYIDNWCLTLWFDTPALPDLVVTDLTVTNSAPQIGTAIDIEFTIANQGAADVQEDVWWSFYKNLDGPPGPRPALPISWWSQAAAPPSTWRPRR